jgi:hypothetical protein
MPKSVNDHGSAVEADGGAPMLDLAERARRAEELTLDYWLKAVVSSTTGGMTVRALQSSISWRVTKPLRAARLVQRRLRTAGVRRTVEMVRERLAEIRQARKRG